MYELKNHTESVVFQALQDYLAKTELSCTCERCQADIMAMVLNRLPARYYVSTRGKIMTQWESSALPDKTRVISEIVQACSIVSKSPSHENQDD